MSAPRDRPAGVWTRCRPDWLSFVALAALALAFFLSARLPPDYQTDDVSSGVEGAGGPPHVQDFAFHFNYARRATGRSGVSPYSVEEHRRFIRAWLGPHVGSALCFGYSPTLVLLFAPLFALPTPWAWLVWNLASAWLAAWAVRRGAGGDRSLLKMGRIALISPNVLYCLALGQTALFTTGVLTAILICAGAGGARSAAACAAFAFVLTMKPPLAIVAGVALVAAGCWSSVLAASGGALAVLAAAVGRWGTRVVGDYLTLLSRYNLVEADPVFRAGFVPRLMSNLRNVLLHGGLDDAQASAISWVIFVATLTVPAVLALATRRRWRFELALAWTATSYALFSPHLSSTEDLILIVVLIGLWRAAVLPARLRLPCVAFCLLPQFAGGSAAMVLGSGPEGAVAGLLPLVAFGIKIGLAVVVAGSVLRTVSRSSL